MSVTSDRLTKWDPNTAPPFGLPAAQDERSATPQQQRHVLNDVIGRLQRAIEAGGEYAVFEREETPMAPFTPSPRRNRDGLEGLTTPTVMDSAASVLAQQYEAIGRREVALLEADTRVNFLHLYIRITDRRAAQTSLSQRMATENLEAVARRRMEECRASCLQSSERELDRTVRTLRAGQQAQQIQEMLHAEGRERHRLELERADLINDMSIFRAASLERYRMQDQGFFKTVERERASRCYVELEQTTGMCRLLQLALSDRPANRPSRRLKIDRGMPLLPVEDDGTAIGPGSDYASCSGWLFKSTGVHTSWQKRFFTFHDGVLKFSTSEESLPTTLLLIESVARVEADVYSDSSQCVRPPPAAKFHQYGFYVDCIIEKGYPKRRLRFCCLQKQDLNVWMSTLRRSVDIAYVKTEVAQHGSMLPTWFDGDRAPPYRTRVQLEEHYGSSSPRSGSPPRPLHSPRSPSAMLRSLLIVPPVSPLVPAARQ